jgi:F0F1-type ATP synthase assembly protein I
MANDSLNRDAQRMGWLYATALNFVISAAVFAVIGYLLDRWLKTSPWFLVGGLVFGLVGGTVKFVRDGLALNRQVARETQEKGRTTQWNKPPAEDPPEADSDGTQVPPPDTQED